MFLLKSARTTAIAGVLAFGSIVGFSTDANAASATALATINWDLFDITLIGEGMELSFDAQSDTTVATAASNGVNPLVTAGPNVTPNWVDGSFASAETGNANYNGNSTAQTPSIDSENGVFQSESSTFSGKAGWDVDVDSSATRSLDFTVSGSGLVVFTVNYSLFAEAGGSDAIANDTASAVAKVTALLRNLTNNATPVGNSTASLSASFDLAALNFGSSADSSSTLAVVMFFNAGDQGRLDISAISSAATSSPAPIPLPAAGWLLGASLVMLARRRRVA